MNWICSFAITIFFLTLTSCKENITRHKQQQDSLFVVLNSNIKEIQQLEKFKSKNFSMPDSLSHQDSLMFISLLNHYQKAHQVTDSITNLLQQIKSECDSLNQYRTTYDTSLIKRLQYLTGIQKKYLVQYYQTIAAAKQNESILQIILNNAQK